MSHSFTVSIWQEDGWYIVQCLEVDIASQGMTRSEAIENLKEALRLHFTPPIATILPDITSIKVELHAA